MAQRHPSRYAFALSSRSTLRRLGKSFIHRSATATVPIPPMRAAAWRQITRRSCRNAAQQHGEKIDGDGSYRLIAAHEPHTRKQRGT
jgi:hypothetical protein